MGSGPGAMVPPGFNTIVAANGGVGIAKKAGKFVDILCTTSYLCRSFPSPSEYASVKTWEGMCFLKTWVDITGGSESQYLFRKHDYKFSSHTDIFVDHQLRNEMVEKVCGLGLGWHSDPYKRISTGMFAVCLSLISGCERVTFSGISLDPRHHLKADLEFLRLIKILYPDRVLSTDGVFA